MLKVFVFFSPSHSGRELQCEGTKKIDDLPTNMLQKSCYRISERLVFLRLLFLFKLALLFINRSYDATTTSIVAELAEVDALPGAEGKATVGDGDGEAHTEERTLGVGGHVVGTLHRVVIVGLTLPHEAVHDLAEVGAHVGVGILVDGESA